MWRATILTLFPEMFPGPLGISLAGRALSNGIWACEARDIRDAATDKHRTVDDTPAGGGAGMVMRADVLAKAIDHTAPEDDPRPKLLMTHTTPHEAGKLTLSGPSLPRYGSDCVRSLLVDYELRAEKVCRRSYSRR